MRSYGIGDVVCDDFVVKLPLGAGGMGEVYLVEHVSTGELRAAKVIKTDAANSADDLSAFRQEATALLNVGNHPFVVRLFDVRTEGSDTVLLMEYVSPSGGCITARDFIVRKQGFGDRRLGAWAVQFCVGMEHALTTGIAAHRDIKPANLLIDSGSFLKIADFGLALAVSRHLTVDGGSSTSTSHLQWLVAEDWHRTCGTPGYVAPELFFGGKASPQSDMFSFGVTLWQLAARSLASPFGAIMEGRDAVDFQRDVLENAMARRVRRVDSPFFAVAERCMAPDPAQRYRDFLALREAIKSAMKSADIPAMDFIVAPGFRGEFEDYINRGRSYLALGRHERALKILERAVEHDPTSYSAKVAYAEALERRGHYVEAVRAFETARRMEPDDPLPLVGMASSWLALDMPGKARDAIARILRDRPDNVEALLLLARRQGSVGDNIEALRTADKVIASDGREWRAHEFRGRALWGLGRLEEAEQALKTSLQINPLALDARLVLSSLLTKLQRKTDAAEEYRHAVKLFRDNPETLHRIAAHMSGGGHEEAAIEVFYDLADQLPESRSTMLVCVGNAMLNLGDQEGAVAHFRQAITADPDDALPYCRLGELETENERHAEAARYFARACDLDPGNYKYQSFAGVAYLREQDYGRAIEHLRCSIEHFPEQPFDLYNLAVALCCEGQQEAALEELGKAVRLDESYGRGWYLRAQIEAGLGRDTEAANSVRKAIANRAGLSDPELRGARELMERLPDP